MSDITLLPIAMTTPSQESVYSISQLRPALTTDDETFYGRYIDQAKRVPVVINGRRQKRKTYGLRDGWYIVEE